MKDLFWLRSETKTGEARCILTPAQCGELVARGAEVLVEHSTQRIFPDALYAESGCQLVAAGHWPDAPNKAWILGLKELPVDTTPLAHRHVYFAHAYKQQAGWRALLERFQLGGGKLYDLEYLVDENDRRVAAFGYWAGFAGSALALKIWSGIQLGDAPPVPALSPYPDRQALLNDVTNGFERARAMTATSPRVLIIGAKGRVGQGAADLAVELGLQVTRWDMEETARGGPFAEVLTHEIFINCVLVQKKIAPFVDRQGLDSAQRKLAVISDVSCDPGIYNPVPLYEQCTSFSEPAIQIIDGDRPLYLTAIDHLPSLLPAEASDDFGSQLLPYLFEPGEHEVWKRALQVFEGYSAGLKA